MNEKKNTLVYKRKRLKYTTINGLFIWYELKSPLGSEKTSFATVGKIVVRFYIVSIFFIYSQQIAVHTLT